MNCAKTVTEDLAGDSKRRGLILDFVKALRNEARLEAVGLRLAEGNDFPFFCSYGFRQSFLECEASLKGLCANKSCGSCLDCVCGCVLSGRPLAPLPCYTSYGSFFINRLEDFPALIRDRNGRSYLMRNGCCREGSESLALIPLKADEEIFGLLLLTNRSENAFSLERVNALETVSVLFARTIAKSFSGGTIGKPSQVYDTMTEILSLRDSDLGNHFRDLDAITNKLEGFVVDSRERPNLVAVCCFCNRCRNANGEWKEQRFGNSAAGKIEFTHTYCPECFKENYGVLLEESDLIRSAVEAQ